MKQQISSKTTIAKAKPARLPKSAQPSILTARDFQTQGIPREYLSRRHRSGQLERVARGIYRQPEAQVTEHHDLAVAALRVPRGVVCLLSALQFHELTTQLPGEIWLALDRKAHRPNSTDGTSLRIVRFSGAALAEGVEEHTIEGVRVRIYNPAKTVADSFKYRNKIGVDVAIEALRDVWRKRQAGVNELMHYAHVCRVSNVMRPYLEAVVA